MTDKNTAELLREFELSLVNPYVRKSRQELEKLLADDYVEFGSSGKIYDKKSSIDLMLAEGFSEISISKFKASFPSENIALLTYEAEIRDRTTKYVKRSLRSSLWQNDGEGWRIIFHQGTPL